MNYNYRAVAITVYIALYIFDSIKVHLIMSSEVLTYKLC